MLLSELYILPHLSDDLNISLSDHASERCCDDLFSDTVHDTAMYETCQYFRIGDTLGYLLNHLWVSLAVSRLNIVAYAYVTTLKCRIEFGQLIDDILVKVKDATVILT